MSQDDDPLISIVTVNFNGKKFLSNLFNSILNLNYPSEKIQIIMVDNASTDGSIEFVRQRFPQVEIVELQKNLGFAGGNNEGFKRIKGEYIALVNNDCVVDRDWLKEMISIFKESSSSSIGAVGPRVVFYYSYLPLQFITISASPRDLKEGKSIRRLGVKVSNVRVTSSQDLNIEESAGANQDRGYAERAGSFIDTDRNEFLNYDLLNRSIKYLDGFYPPESTEEGVVYHWTKDSAILAIPIPDEGKDMTLQFDVSSYLSPNNLQLVVGGEILYELEVGRDLVSVVVNIPKVFFGFKKDIINSCGVKVNSLFYSRERGYLSFDEGQYGRVEEIFGLSGTSFLMNKKMLEDIGGFDEDFFTYYEDIDFFWRARLKGWKMFFTPHSVVRHVHCGSGQEWSSSFTYHVIRNRLLMIFKCGWPTLFIKCYFAFVGSTILNLFFYMVGILKGKKQKRIDIPIRIRVFFELFYLIPGNWIKRLKIRLTKKIPDKAIKSWIRSFY